MRYLFLVLPGKRTCLWFYLSAKNLGVIFYSIFFPPRNICENIFIFTVTFKIPSILFMSVAKYRTSCIYPSHLDYWNMLISGFPHIFDEKFAVWSTSDVILRFCSMPLHLPNLIA